jgi:mannose-6-phosphate isomerase-like protein (cupin superfamily)
MIKTSKESICRKQKGWGYEIWIENSPLYCGKLLHFEKGKKTSMHFHMKKTETMYVQTGQARIHFITEGIHASVDLDPGDKLLIEPGQMHRIEALDELDLFEFSTFHEESDSYRIEKGD